MEFILMLIAFFGLNVSASDLSDSEINDLEETYYEIQTVNTGGVNGIRREIQTLK
ncbi:MAG: hypothetical protein IE891_03080 [Flavobacteriaceae bacterium]|nr:hypothetical protein [Flavobacteriaceae bacterium]